MSPETRRLKASHRVVPEAVTEDVVHVLMQPLQAAVVGPDVRIVSGQQPLHRGLQPKEELPVLSPKVK